jgi:hypothetical protein
MALTRKIELFEINYVENRIELIAECNEYDENDNRTLQLSRSPFIFLATMTLEEIEAAIKIGDYAWYFE